MKIKKKQNINENIIKAQELLQKLQEKKNIMNETIKELKTKKFRKRKKARIKR